MSWAANSGRGRIANTSRVADPGEAVRCTNGLCEIERIANGTTPVETRSAPRGALKTDPYPRSQIPAA
jgi:hypothetical protein